ncbi:MAG TPA: hypothetical protein VHV55_17555 [Pirellulales bacterium]|jgi:hypothetical protein|nr:hypothetical protein [Pirellulales bacterium]
MTEPSPQFRIGAAAVCCALSFVLLLINRELHEQRIGTELWRNVVFVLSMALLLAILGGGLGVAYGRFWFGKRSLLVVVVFLAAAWVAAFLWLYSPLSGKSWR